mmetsp:Transcript_2591/g.6622  ORF Transcript_2591/g.6622 Transcript_2591/m.6622 type:complete len:282 (+) Transcript_2591:305-1150(+)
MKPNHCWLLARSVSKNPGCLSRPTSRQLSIARGMMRLCMGTVCKSVPAACTHSRTALGPPAAERIEPGGIAAAFGTVCGSPAAPPRLEETLSTSILASVSSTPLKVMHEPSASGTGSSSGTSRSLTNSLFCEILRSNISPGRLPSNTSKCAREMHDRLSASGTIRSKNSGWCCLPTTAVVWPLMTSIYSVMALTFDGCVATFTQAECSHCNMTCTICWVGMVGCEGRLGCDGGKPALLPVACMTGAVPGCSALLDNCWLDTCPDVPTVGSSRFQRSKRHHP